MPTLGEFIVHARKYGFRKRSLTLGLGPKDRDRIIYLWRDAEHFAELPHMRESERLTRVVVETLCGQLGIPVEDFELGD